MVKGASLPEDTVLILSSMKPQSDPVTITNSLLLPPGVFVLSPSPQEVSVVFHSGAALEARVHEGTMAATVLLPAEFTDLTRGLLGVMNSDPSDDLLTQRGEFLSVADATPEEIFTFGAGCEWGGLSELCDISEHPSPESAGEMVRSHSEAAPIMKAVQEFIRS